MQRQPLPFDPRALDEFVALAGRRPWALRLGEIGRLASVGPRTGAAVQVRHGLELAIERLRGPMTRPPAVAELHAAALAAETVALHRRLRNSGKRRLRERLASALSGGGTLMPLFHLLRTASLQGSRGFAVAFSGLEEGAAWDLVISRESLAAEVVCDVVSAEEGRLVRRDSWVRLTDRVVGDLREWLAANPGRHLLKMTLPQGLHEGTLVDLQERIRRLLRNGRRRDDDDAVVLRLDPLAWAGHDVSPWLRREFGPEAHLAIASEKAGLFVMVARAGRADEVGVAMRRRLAAIAPQRLSGTRPGILAMFIEDTDRTEWRGLRERLELEGEARQFLAHKDARPVIAVTCSSRFELFGVASPDGVEDGDLRFRNTAHPSAKAAALAPAVLSSV